MGLTFAMVVLEVRDVQRSVAFYRLLGLDVPEPRADRPVSVCRLGNGVKLVLTEAFASRHDPTWVRPEAGYQQLLEFYAGDDAAVDAEWARLTAAGCPGRMAPVPTGLEQVVPGRREVHVQVGEEVHRLRREDTVAVGQLWAGDRQGCRRGGQAGRRRVLAG